MKKLLSAVTFILVSGLASAEPSGGPRGNYFGQLDLSDEQRENISEISKNGGGREEIHAILDADQLAKLEELREERKHARGGDREKKLERMRTHLDLSDEQVEEMRAIIEAGGSREEVHAVLTEEQREKRDKMRKLHGGKKGKKSAE